MQLFVRCGAPLGSVALECGPEETVLHLKDRLAARAPQLLGPASSMRLIWSGRQLHDSDLLGSALQRSHTSHTSQPAWATLQLTHRLLGGGGDGGSTGAESRSCYLEMYAGKKIEKVNPAEELLAQYTRCHLSNEMLSPPVVVDELGSLFNKDAIVTALLDKSMPSALAHISSLKHLTEVKLTRSETGPSKGAGGSGASAYCCPVTGVALNGRYKFVVHRPTGHLVSEKALKDAPAVVEDLIGCPAKSEDMLPVNPTGDVLEALQHRVLARMAEEREKKRSKKEAKSKSKADVAAVGAAAAAAGGAAAAGAAGGGNDTVPQRDVSPTPDAAAVAMLAGTKRSAAAAAAAGAGAGRGALPPAAGVADGNGTAAAAAAAVGPAAKKAKALALDSMPKHSTTSVYASLFSSSVTNPQKETYCCRSTSARGVHLT